MVEMTFVEWLKYFAESPKEKKKHILTSSNEDEELIAATYCIFPIM